MRGEMAPIGVVYGLDYLALRPAYHVKLHIDWDRTQDIMDKTYGHEGLFTSDPDPGHGREAGGQPRHRRSRSDTFVPEDEGGTVTERRDAAVARVRDMITDAFFESSIDPLRAGAGRLGQGGRHHQVVLTAALRADGRVLLQEDALLADRTRSGSTSTSPSASRIKRSMYPQGHLSGLFRVLGAGARSQSPRDRGRRRRSVVQAAQGARDLARRLRRTIRCARSTPR